MIQKCLLMSALSLLIPASVLAADTSGTASATPAPDSQSASNNSSDVVSADRGGFTNGSDTVPKGRVQVESAATRTTYSAGNGGGHATDAPEMLVRTGLNDTTELRLTLPNYVWPSSSANGFSDGAVSIRHQFGQSKDGNTKFAITPGLSIPIKSSVTSSGHVDPVINLSGQTSSGARWGISSNLILAYPTQNDKRLADYTATFEVSYSPSGPLSVFGDFYEDVPVGRPPTPIADTGFTLKIAKNIQVDLGIGYGLGAAAPVRFYTGGIAVRF